jgi:hypothetical protein
MPFRPRREEEKGDFPGKNKFFLLSKMIELNWKNNNNTALLSVVVLPIKQIPEQLVEEEAPIFSIFFF